MANKKLDFEKIFGLVMDCRTSGLSDRQWCIEHDVHPSTFYNWVRRLRAQACYEIPDNEVRGGVQIPACSSPQDVVRVDIIHDIAKTIPASSPHSTNAPVVLQYREVNILLQDNFNPDMLRNIITCLKDTIC